MLKRIGFATILTHMVLPSITIAASLSVQTSGTTTTLRVDADPPFRSTQSAVSQATLVQISGTTLILVHWRETPSGGIATPFYAFAHDGHQFTYVRPTDYTLRLRYAEFDPLVSTPTLPSNFQADVTGRLYIVQFFTQPLEQLENGVIAAGGIVRAALPSNSKILEMSAGTRASVAGLSYVRWVGPFHPGYRLEDYLRDNWAQRETLFPLQRYNIMVFEPGLAQKNAVAARIQSIGGTVNVVTPDGCLLIATLTPSQLEQVIRWDEVTFVDRWMPPVLTMDNARKIGGAAMIEAFPGFTGEGVRGEVMDTWFELDHPAFRGVCSGGGSAGAACSNDSQCPAEPVTVHPL